MKCVWSATMSILNSLPAGRTPSLPPDNGNDGDDDANYLSLGGTSFAPDGNDDLLTADDGDVVIVDDGNGGKDRRRFFPTEVEMDGVLCVHCRRPFSRDSQNINWYQLEILGDQCPMPNVQFHNTEFQISHFKP